VTNTFTVYYGTSIEFIYWPLYFLYKIISTINLTKELKAKYPYNFVPIYWMATEDHDFEEINYFNFKEGNSDGTRSTGPVGLSTDGLSDVFLYCPGTGFKHQCETLKSLFEDAYLKHDNLGRHTPISEFTFGTYGLVILDADDADLKRPLFLLQRRFSHSNLP
jgi:hypothetical protein